MKSPCFNCQNRTPGCHGACGKYLSFMEENAQERERIHKEKRNNHYYRDIEYRSSRRGRK